MTHKENGPAAVARGEARSYSKGTLDAHLLTAWPGSRKNSHGSASYAARSIARRFGLPVGLAATLTAAAVIDAPADIPDLIPEAPDDAALAALIEAWTKRQITDAYSFGLCSEELAIRLIRKNGLVHA